MQCNDEQKAILKRCLEDAKYRTKMKQVLKDIIFDNIGTYTIEKVSAWKDIIGLFDEATKD